MSVVEDIDSVLPHRDGMRLIDRVLQWDDESIVVEVDVPSHGLFVDPEGVPAWVGVEYMAQAIAAWAGCRARARGAEPSIGFLLGTRRYLSSTPWFRSGSVLRVEARCELIGDNGLGMFACRIVEQATEQARDQEVEQELATANVSVFEPTDAMAYLESGHA